MRPARAVVVKNTKNVVAVKTYSTKLISGPLQALIEMIIIDADYDLNATILAP